MGEKEKGEIGKIESMIINADAAAFSLSPFALFAFSPFFSPVIFGIRTSQV